MIRANVGRGNKPLVQQLFEMSLLHFRGSVSPLQYYDYKLGKKGASIKNLNYLSRHTYWKIQHELNHQHWLAIAENKWLFYTHMASFGLPVPRTYGYYDTMNGCTFQGQPLRTELDLKAMLQTCQAKEFVIKPIKGGMGRDVLVLKANEDYTRFEDLGASVFSLVDLAKHMAKHPFLVQERVRQHRVLNEINPYTLNTFRIVTFVDIKGEPHIHWIGMRMGRKGSNTDNAHAGGIIMHVDPITGELGKASYLDGEAKALSTHPDSGVEFAGKLVPYWREICELALKSARLCPLGAVGWDIALSEEGPLLIEVNARWFYRQPQKSKPYITDEVRQHLAGYGIRQP
jgi:glutathione synthase/RimK-type ligase-like ATP-grasp enzyme